jgi:hypothetical protein
MITPVLHSSVAEIEDYMGKFVNAISESLLTTEHNQMAGSEARLHAIDVDDIGPVVRLRICSSQPQLS